MNICFTASSGGHLEEISALRKINENNNCFLITEESNFDITGFCQQTYYVKQINRKELSFIFKLITTFIYCIKIIKRENPDCIISTGALSTIPVCLAGRLLGKKIIYIESFARIDSPSLTGRFMYKIADLFIVQWEEMLNIFPNAVYGGSIF